MKVIIALFSLLAAVAIAAPAPIDGLLALTSIYQCDMLTTVTARSDTEPAMSDGQGGAIPYQNTGTPAG